MPPLEDPRRNIDVWCHKSRMVEVYRMLEEKFENMFIAVSTQYRGVADRQTTSCHGIVRAYADNRAVMTFESTSDH